MTLHQENNAHQLVSPTQMKCMEIATGGDEMIGVKISELKCRDMYILMHMRESPSIVEGKAVYVITLTFRHLLIDSPVTRQKG